MREYELQKVRDAQELALTRQGDIDHIVAKRHLEAAEREHRKREKMEHEKRHAMQTEMLDARKRQEVERQQTMA